MSVPRKGENFELRADLNSEYREKRADAIKRVIANMTVGKDVSGLFPDVLKNMQTEDLEQKKLVYLYLMNYAKEQPELVILAVNTFVKDTADPNPLVRALAIRTMSCLRADKILSYLSDPLHRTLHDESPYVRKTAALAVAKLFDLKPSLALEGGFVEVLREMVGDGNPMVVANAVAALSDIQEAYDQARSRQTSRSDDGAEPAADDADSEDEDDDSPSALAGGAKELFAIDGPTLSKLLIALNECSEWGRIALLSALARFKTADVETAEHICERVMPQFQHANGGVLLGAVRVVMIHLKTVERDELRKMLVKKMAPPLVTLISSAPEIQWVALRNISLLLQAEPDLLASEMRVFFCKYNDPPYVKVEKLAIMVRLANEANVGTLLSELKEYASEIDVDMVRKSVKAIGQVAIKIPDAADRCVAVLLELIATRISYVVQEAVVVMKDVFRKYPFSYEGVIPTLCANLDELESPEAKSSLIWIVGEYADKIDNADELLGAFLKTFKDEPYAVQLQTLTAIVKLFLKKPDESQQIVQQVLETATKECDSPDVRDRAYVYWRLLSSDPAAAKAVVLADRPPIGLAKTTVPRAVLDELLGELSTLASVYHRPAETFVGRGRVGIDDLQRRAAALALEGGEDGVSARDKALHVVEQGQKAENLLDFDDDPEPTTSIAGASSSLGGLDFSSSSSSYPQQQQQAAPPPAATTNPLDDMMDLFNQSGLGAPTSAPAPASRTAPVKEAASPFDSLGLGGGFGGGGLQAQTQTKPPPQQQPQQSDDLLGLF